MIIKPPFYAQIFSKVQINHCIEIEQEASFMSQVIEGGTWIGHMEQSIHKIT